MLKNYLKITLRNLVRFKTYFLVNVVGLSIGMACTVLALVFVSDELSFDQFHTKAESIYRLNKFTTNDVGVKVKTSETSGLMGPQAVNDFPQIESFVRFKPWFDSELISYREQHFNQDLIVFADSNFFNVFDFELLIGDRNEVLKQPKSVVLTESVANKVFGDKNPLGEFVEVLGAQFQVTGVAADSPRNSHMQYEVLISWSSTLGENGGLNYGFFNNWISQSINTYLVLQPGANVAELDSQLDQMIATNLPEREGQYDLYLQPFNEIYLNSDDIQFGNANLRLGSKDFITIFNFIAVFVLLIAVVNYINISTSKALRRSLEVGVRKVMGAKRRQLFTQFVGEAFLITLISTLVAVLIVDLSIPAFNELMDRHLTNQVFTNTDVIISILGVMVVTSLLSGAYPGLVLSSFKPSLVLRTGKKGLTGKAWLRKSMIVFQFFLATLLITSSIIVYNQNEFLLRKDLGFNQERLLVISLDSEVQGKASLIQQEFEKHPDVLNTSATQAAIGSGTFGSTIIPEGFNEPIDVRIFRVDHDFIDVYGIEMVEGRKFDRDRPTDAGAIIINEAMAEFMGWTEATSKTVRFAEGEQQIPILGVTKDFHYYGLNHNKIEPMVMYLNERTPNLSVRLSGNNTAEAMAYISEAYAKFDDRFPMNYYFVEDWFARQYEAEQNFLVVVGIFSALSILISCLGLYGLVSYFIEQRIKEIGIRKVLGASVLGITFSINTHFTKLVLMSFLMSIPVCYWLMSLWLANFSYRVGISVWPFLVASVVVMLVALATTSNQAIRAGKMNPVKSLRYE